MYNIRRGEQAGSSAGLDSVVVDMADLFGQRDSFKPNAKLNMLTVWGTSTTWYVRKRMAVQRRKSVAVSRKSRSERGSVA